MNRYEKLCNIVDDAKINSDQDTDIYASAIVSLYDLTEGEKRIVAQALTDYQEGIERAVGDGVEIDVEVLDNVITSIESKLELP